MNTIIAVLSMGGLGAFFALGLVIADRFLHTEEDPRLREVAETLPGTNCGGCGSPGCAKFAENLIGGETTLDRCVVLSDDEAAIIGDMLGIDASPREAKIARALCQGGFREAPLKGHYVGAQSCVAAQFASGGAKICSYGCLGFGDCMRACPFDAIYMSDNGLPVILEDKCTGCGSCVPACPKEIIELHSREHELFVLCKNQDRAQEAKKACSIACSACKLCVKDPANGIFIENNLAIIKYDEYEIRNEMKETCPRGCLVVLNGDTPQEEAKSAEAQATAAVGGVS